MRVHSGGEVTESPAPAGGVEITRAFRAGDVVELSLPIVARATSPHPMVDAVRGSVVIQRGPEVLALESIDLGADVGDAVVVGDPVESDGHVVMPVRHRSTGDTVDAPLIAYHDWARRGPSTMRVWIPTA